MPRVRRSCDELGSPRAGRAGGGGPAGGAGAAAARRITYLQTETSGFDGRLRTFLINDRADKGTKENNTSTFREHGPLMRGVKAAADSARAISVRWRARAAFVLPRAPLPSREIKHRRARCLMFDHVFRP
ncbi:hypothetical protein EVAR_86384_1 [Eumeta japonica]|uniref:Uncharacterized protein n=1 Tax=Eumeta variegata TaxID=151549 RepID=A0A4C1WBD6_EUMVA|nr:hypothetical protein EVAR_86384_1 [Eumeta japonica]